MDLKIIGLTSLIRFSNKQHTARKHESVWAMYSSPNISNLSSLDLKKQKKKRGVKKNEYFITKGRSPRNKSMSLAILLNNFQDLSEENEHFPINIRTIVELVLEKSYHIDSIPKISKWSTKKGTTTKEINFAQKDLLQCIGLT